MKENYYIRLSCKSLMGVGYGSTLYGARAASMYDLVSWRRAAAEASRLESIGR